MSSHASMLEKAKSWSSYRKTTRYLGNDGKKWRPALLLVVLFIMAVLVTTVPNGRDDMLQDSSAQLAELNSGSLAYMMIAQGQVLLMTPALAFFYGGMVRAKNMISTLLTSFTIMSVIGLVWTLIGFSLAFGENELGGLIGNPSTYYFMRNVGFQPASMLDADEIPLILFASFEAVFAMLAPAIIMGAISERSHFVPMIVFAIVWHIVVYCPLAHMQWHPDGLLRRFGHLDYAGGTVVHLSSGLSALVLAHLIGERSHAEHHHSPAHLPYVLFGTAILWFGWQGFNGGSTYSASPLAAYAVYNTNTAAASGCVGWMLWDRMWGRKISLMGGCCGAVVGLVVISPACGYINIGAAFLSGLIGAIISNMTCTFMKDTGSIDDNLDVFAVHGMGGLSGMFLLAFFACSGVNPDVGTQGLEGIVYGSGKLLWHTIVATLLVGAYCMLATLVIFFFINRKMPFRVTSDMEALGMDAAAHGEVVLMGGSASRLFNTPKKRKPLGEFQAAPSASTVRQEQPIVVGSVGSHPLPPVEEVV